MKNISVGQDVFKIDEQGDAYYIVVQGKVSISIPVLSTDHSGKQTDNMQLYLQFLNDNYDKIYWKKIPGSRHIKEFLA